MLSPFSHLDAAIAGVCLTCHDAGRPEGCRRCARRPREPVVSAIAGEDRVTPSMMKTPEEMAAEVIAKVLPRYPEGTYLSCRAHAEEGARLARSHLCSLLEGIRSAHSAGGELDAVGYAAEVLALVARMGMDGA